MSEKESACAHVEAMARAKVVAERMHEYIQALSYTDKQKAIADILWQHFKIKGALLQESRFERDMIALDLNDYTAFTAEQQNKFGIYIDESDLRLENWDTFGKMTTEVGRRLAMKRCE